MSTAKLMVHAFAASGFDYCNALYFGLPKSLFSTLQSVLNAVAHSVAKLLNTLVPQTLC